MSKSKPRDGWFEMFGLVADFRFVRWHKVTKTMARVETAAGETWASESLLHWDYEPPKRPEGKEA